MQNQNQLTGVTFSKVLCPDVDLELSDEELEARLGHLGTRGQCEAKGMALEPVAMGSATTGDAMVPAHPGLRTLFVHSLADEHVPKRINVTILADRFVRAVGEDDAERRLVLGDNVGEFLERHAEESD